MAACTSPSAGKRFVFPSSFGDEYAGPDGIKWVVHHVESNPDGTFWAMFTTEQAERGKWKELLMFGLKGESASQDSVRKALEVVRTKDDPTIVYRFEGGPDAFVLTYRSDRWNESGVQKTVRTAQGYRLVVYQERLGQLGEKRLRFWTDFISSIPDRAFMPRDTPSLGDVRR